MKLDDEIELKIEKLTYEGAGLGFYENSAVFVEKAAPNELLKVKIVKVAKNHFRGEIVEIIQPSPSRVKPLCPLFNACGGCSWQYVDYKTQVEQKTNIVKEALRKFDVKVEDTIKCPKNIGFRNKIQLPIRQTKVSKRVLAGYFKNKTHEIIDVKHCAVQFPMAKDVVDALRNACVDGKNVYFDAYDEKAHRGVLRHLIIRKGSKDEGPVVVFVVNADSLPIGIKRLAVKMFHELNLKGCCVNFNTRKGNVILGKETTCIIGEDFVEEQIGDKVYKVSGTSFFQVNPYGAFNIFEIVKNLVKENSNNPSVLDAYGGVGALGIYVGDLAKSVTIVEEVPSAVRDAKENIELNNSKNIDVIEGDVKNIFNDFLNQGKTFDLTILDPPRSGLEPQSLESVIKLTNSIIIYVSCNPQTLARDMKILEDGGFKAIINQPVDMFCHTYHIESVTLFKKA